MQNEIDFLNWLGRNGWEPLVVYGNYQNRWWHCPVVGKSMFATPAELYLRYVDETQPRHIAEILKDWFLRNEENAGEAGKTDPASLPDFSEGKGAGLPAESKNP